MRTTKSEIKRVRWIVITGLIFLGLVLIFNPQDVILLFSSFAKWFLSCVLVHWTWIFLFGRYDAWEMYLQNDARWGDLMKARILFYVSAMIAIALIR